ncbi:hypothetical protein ACHAWF_009523 [Thalassiosira exigua]
MLRSRSLILRAFAAFAPSDNKMSARFVVRYERDTAVACVRRVFPASEITTHSNNSYPIKVLIEAHDEDGGKVKVWKGDQKSLFRKHASRREAAQRDMVEKLEEYKKSRA